MKNNQDEIKKEMLSKQREYLPGTTVAQVDIQVSLHRAYIDLESKNKMFEVLDIHSERFDARIRSDDAYEARDMMRQSILESTKGWEILPGNISQDEEENKQEESDDTE